VAASGTTSKNHTFPVSAGEHLYIQLDWSEPSANLNLTLKNPSGTVVAAATGANKPEVVQVDASLGGTWKITVNARSGASSYRVLVNPKNALPIARFNVSCTQRTCSFDGSTSSDRDGPIAEYAWHFGDGTSASGPVVSHEYPAAASYTATLTVTDAGDLTDMASAAVSTVTRKAEWVFTDSGSSAAGTVKNHSISVTAPKHIRAVLDWNDPTARINLFLKNPAGTTVASATGAKPEVIDYDATVSGTWKLAVVYKSGAATYELLVNPGS
jgi:PKD repeat protein